MSQEDDLRGLAKVIDFMRAISILFVLIHCYWFCYESFREWNITIEVVDRILINFQKNTGLFSSLLWTKLFAVLFLGLSCLGTRGVKDEKITWRNIITLNPQLHSRSATYIKRNGLLIRKITIKSSRPFQCAYHPLTP